MHAGGAPERRLQAGPATAFQAAQTLPLGLPKSCRRRIPTRLR